MHQLFKLSRVKGAPVSNESLLEDLKRVAILEGNAKVTQSVYRQLGAYDESTISRRFGTWNRALTLAGIQTAHETDLPDERLFENLLILWQHHGRQPRRAELACEPSIISQSPYNRRFGSWTAALEAFIRYMNEQAVEPLSVPTSQSKKRRTGRDPSLRLRFRVLQRDSFSCRTCGASPAKTVGVELHVDHIIPWSEGGETELANLQTLCLPCNLGKGAKPQ
jgi:hypothetical protein